MFKIKGGISIKYLSVYILGSSLENYTSNNTTKHKTTRAQQDTTRDNTGTIRDNTTQHECNTRRHEYDTRQHEYKTT